MTGAELEDLAAFIEAQCPSPGRPHWALPSVGPGGELVASAPAECRYGRAAAVLRQVAALADGPTDAVLNVACEMFEAHASCAAEHDVAELRRALAAALQVAHGG